MDEARYELKFLIDRFTKDLLLKEVQKYLRQDPHGVDGKYRISSLYFDTLDLRDYWEKVDGLEIRKKVRLRFYHPDSLKNPKDPEYFFMEVKHRVNQCIYKERYPLHAQDALDILNDPKKIAQLSQALVEEKFKKNPSILRIQEEQMSLGLTGQAIITYVREAWLGTFDEKFRLTFDESCQVYPPYNELFVVKSEGRPICPPQQIIMELKFNHAVPRWMRDVINVLKIPLQRFSKYAHGIESLDKKNGGTHH